LILHLANQYFGRLSSNTIVKSIT